LASNLRWSQGRNSDRNDGIERCHSQILSLAATLSWAVPNTNRRMSTNSPRTRCRRTPAASSRILPNKDAGHKGANKEQMRFFALAHKNARSGASRNLLQLNARDGGRTRTPLAGLRILSPVRLPVPPPRRIENKTIQRRLPLSVLPTVVKFAVTPFQR